jgi:hypothetical protein
MAPSTETQLLDAIVKTAKLTGWWLHHDRPARTERGWRTAVQGNAGFLDVVLARDGIVLFRELKGRYDKPTPGQYDWLQRLAPGWVEQRGWVPPDETAVVADVWRPADWDTRVLPLLNRPRRASLDYRSPVTDGGRHELPDLRHSRPARRAGST